MEDMKPPAWPKLGACFTNEDSAREYIEFLRWGRDGAACPRCGGADPYKIEPKVGSSTRKGVYKCRVKECRRQFTVTVGTVLESSHVPLTKWLQALYLIGASKKGISSHRLHRMLGITYKAAWFMTHRLRYAMSADPLADLLSGVEGDETKRKRNTKRGRPGPGSHRAPAVARAGLRRAP